MSQALRSIWTVMALDACGGKVPDVAVPSPKSSSVAAPASHASRFTAAIPTAALRCSNRPAGNYESENITLWLDEHSLDLARYAPNWARLQYGAGVQIDLLPLGMDCGELARLRGRADAGGMLQVEGVRKWSEDTWRGDTDFSGHEDLQEFCHAGYIDRVELEIDHLFTAYWEWRMPTHTWSVPLKASCEKPAAQLEVGFLMLDPLVANELGVCRADGLAFRVELEFLGWSDVAEETDITGAYMRSVETFPSVAVCEKALAALRAAVDVLYPDIHGLYPKGVFSATRTSRLEKNRQGTSSAYVQTVALAIAERAFILENRFVLAGE